MLDWPLEDIREDDRVVRLGAPDEPCRVIAVHEDKVWIREETSGDEAIIAIGACQRLGTVH